MGNEETGIWVQTDPKRVPPGEAHVLFTKTPQPGMIVTVHNESEFADLLLQGWLDGYLASFDQWRTRYYADAEEPWQES